MASEPVPDERRTSPERERAEQSPARWQWLVGVFIALGCLATAGYAVVETFWG